MKSLFEPAAVNEIPGRMAQLRPDSERQWGKMNMAQMLAHCSAAIGMAEGKVSPPRILLGRLLGPLAKKSLIVNDEPMRRNAMSMAASMTNTGFVALPILQAIYGPRAVLPAAIATVFVAVVMFPIAVVLLELGQRDAHGSRTAPMVTVKHVVLNPMVLSTLIGMLWSVLGLRMPGPVAAYFGILADALTPCALFAIGLGLSIDGLRANIGRASLLSAVKLVIMPLIVYGLSVSLGLDPLYTIAAVICAAVPTAKTAYILAGEYHCEEVLVASTVSMTTLASTISLVIWLYGLSGLATRITAR
jgi:malonate transporter